LGKKRNGILWFTLPILLFLVSLLGISIFLLTRLDNSKTQYSEPPVSNQIKEEVKIEPEQKYVSDEGLEARNYTFEHGCQQYSFALPVYQSKYDYFSGLDRDVYYPNSSRKDPEEEYYKQFLLSDQDEDTIERIIREINSLTHTNTSDDQVSALVSFVQYIEYDCEKLFSYENLIQNDYQTNYPYETLYMNQGVCGDTTLLLAKILNHLGYGSAFLIYEEQNHMALGIRCPNNEANFVEDGVGYCYIETTAPARIGIIPQGIDESETLTNPRIIKVSDGKSFNKMTFLADQMRSEAEIYDQYILSLSSCYEIDLYKKIHEAEVTLITLEQDLLSLKNESDPLAKSLDYQIEQYNQLGCKGTVSKSKYKKCEAELKNVQALQYTYEDVVIEYNNLVDEYNILYDVYSADLNTFDALITSHNTCSGLVFGGQSIENLGPINE
jgi:hypothetical protein